MSDYIDREELIKHIKDLPTWWADGSALCAYYLTKAITSIEEAPAAGRWGRDGILLPPKYLHFFQNNFIKTETSS